MKATKNFATSHGTSHYPSNMKHVEPHVYFVPNLENNGTMVVLTFLRQSDGTELRIRMTPIEAESLATFIRRVSDAIVE